jgi:uncharacterized protein (DUF4415 family)
MAGTKALKTKSTVELPDDDEDARITADAETDPDNPPLTDAEFARMKPLDAFPEIARIVRAGRPPLPDDERKQRVTIYLDRDVVARLKEGGKGWQTRANERLRKALGL